MHGRVNTQINSRVGFWLRRTATEFKPACIAQLIQVVPASLAKERFNALLQVFAAARLVWLKFRALLAKFPTLNPFVY